ncbi:MAG TPA: hypothetical protein VMY05_05010 [Acidobacteriota bacterium]|nr:hypothetical protein [Acidobacteriota bacterium]
MSARTEHVPVVFNIVKWYGYVFASSYLLYGAVKIVLAVLDRKYDSMAQPFIFLLFGLILISVTLAFRETKKWGWYGLVALNVIVIIGALFGLSHAENYILIILSLGALGALFAPATKRCFFDRR